MVYEGFEYHGNNIFDPDDPISIYELQTMKVFVREAPKGFQICSFEVNVTEVTSPVHTFSSHNETISRLWLSYVKDRGIFLLRKWDGKHQSIWTKMVAVAKVDEHCLFKEALLGMSTLKSVSLYIEHLDDLKLTFAAYLPWHLVVPDLESLLHSSPKRSIDPNDLTFFLRMFNLIGAGNFYCNNEHGHDSTSGACMTKRRKQLPPQSSQTIQHFFDNVRMATPKPKQYALRTQKLTARLRPYQRDATRFMINRELHPNLRFQFSSFYYHIKMETDQKPVYYLPNLAIFMLNPPEVPTLSTCGGILADEMGLGKSVELLALITTLTPDHTPEIVDTTREDSKMDVVEDVLDDIISNVVAAVEGEKAVTQFRRKKEVGVMYYNKSSSLPTSPTKRNMISCEECGTSCVQQRVHWSPGLSAQTRFVCPECIMTTKELIPIKTTLIVVPNTIAHQWYEEIRKHVKEEVKIDVYKGVSVDGYKHPHYLNQFDIIITTYDVLQKEKNFLEIHKPTDRLRKRPYEMGKMACTPLFSVLWWRVCLDESQMIDKGTSMISTLCKKLESRARWSITGTPISASIRDVHGLVNFLGVIPLDNELIFDQCVYIPYMKRNNNFLISLMSRIMWRTEKKHLQCNALDVISHVDMVTLSAMEERMYSDLISKSKENVLAVVKGIPPERKVIDLSRQLHSKLFGALSKVEFFLLTSLTGRSQWGRMNGNDEDEETFIFHNIMFTPQSLFHGLLRMKKNMVTRSQRDMILYYNGISAILWNTGKVEEALSYYTKAVNCTLATGLLNETLGHPNAVVFTSKEMNEDEKEEEDENNERVGRPISCDSLQFVHIYRNVQWLLTSSPELVEKSGINMEVVTPLFQQAWRTYSRIEESMYREKEKEWEKTKNEVEECNSDVMISKLKEWIDKLVSSVDSTGNFSSFQSNLERQIGLKFNNLYVMGQWMKSQLNKVKSLSQNLVQLIDRCIEVCNGDDLDDIVSEGRYRMSDLPMVIKSPKKNENKEREKRNLPAAIAPRERGIKKTFIEIRKGECNEIYNVNLMDILTKNTTDLYDGCVCCQSDGEFDEKSLESCIFCATQAMYQRMQMKDPNGGNISRSRMITLETIEKELSTISHRYRMIKKEEETEWKEMQRIWKESMKGWKELDTYWKGLLIVMLEKMNRVRELRQCTIRSESSERLEEEERKLKIVKRMHEKDEHNLKYVYSLREESGISSSSSSNPSSHLSSRECPICFDEIGESWFVFPCAHLNCGKCFNRLVKLQGTDRVSCSVCRNVFPHVAAMYVSNKKKDSLCPVDSLNLSVKLDKIVRLAVSILNNDKYEKMLVFTSLSLGLTVLKSVFTGAKLPFLTLDSDSQRNAAVLSKFRNDPQTRILLMRYESGGKGLNLTVANHIIFANIVDDASLEKQAIGRCDRIGQTKNVHLHYIIAQDTVDERMYKLTREVRSTAYIKDDNWTVGTLVDVFTET